MTQQCLNPWWLNWEESRKEYHFQIRRTHLSWKESETWMFHWGVGCHLFLKTILGAQMWNVKAGSSHERSAHPWQPQLCSVTIAIKKIGRECMFVVYINITRKFFWIYIYLLGWSGNWFSKSDNTDVFENKLRYY